jgi:hypothetical protein
MEKMTSGQMLEILTMLFKAFFKMLLGEKVEFDAPRKTAQNIIKGDPDLLFAQFVKFLANACVQFNPAEFIGKGWAFWKGPKDGKGLEGEEERDGAAMALIDVDFEKSDFLTCLEPGESSITGEEKLVRLRKLGRPLYGVNQFMELWQDYQQCQDKSQSKVEKLYQQKGITFIAFFGDILRSPSGNRSVLYLCRDNDGSWNWNYYWLDSDYVGRSFAPVPQQVSSAQN